jgi:putative ATP-dependent endonuclease of OLD family
VRILRLSLSNFRAFKTLDVKLEPDVNVIVGENNVGKSLLLQAIDWAKSLPIGSQPPNSFWPEGKPEGTLSVSLVLGLESKEEKKLHDLIPAPQKQIIRGDPTLDLVCQSPNHVFEVRLRFVESGNTVLIVSFEPNMYGNTIDPQRGLVLGSQQYNSLRTMLSDSIYHFPEFRYRPSAAEISEGDNLRATEGTRLAAVLFRLRVGTRAQRRLFEEIRESFHTLFPDLDFQAVKMANQPVIVVNHVGSEYEVPLAEMGAGIFEILLVLTHIAREHDRIFLMDEPEAHLHPHAQRLLEKELRKFSKANQLVLTTHSPQFVDFSHLSSVILVKRDSGSSVAVKLPEGYLANSEETKASRILWSEEKEFLFSKRVLLVEGPTEFGALPILADRMGKNLDENGVTLASIGGYHFALPIKILKGFGLPYLTLCDADVLNEINGHIEFEGKRVKTSPLFETAEKVGLLGDQDKRILVELETKTMKGVSEKGTDKEVYGSELQDQLKTIAERLGFRIMSPDFEGVLERSGYRTLLVEANNLYMKNKVLKGRYLAQKIDQIPDEIRSVIEEITKA